MLNLKIISREEWKANNPRYAFTKHYPTKITIHHQGASNEKPLLKVQPLFKGEKTIKSIQEYHQKTNTWCDLGYHAVISPNGDIYQGRPFDVVGSHVKSNNTGNIGIMLIGNFEVEQPTKEQLTSLKNLLQYLTLKFPQIKLPEHLYGHKEFMSTDCPGKNLYPIIFDMKTKKISWYNEPDTSKKDIK